MKFVNLIFFKLVGKKLSKVLKEISFELKFKGILVWLAHDRSLVDVQEGLFLICSRPTLADVSSLFLYDACLEQI